MNMDPSAWIKASRSGNSGNCVEMRRAGGLVEVRDSKDRSGPVLHFAGEEFTAWIEAAKQGELDRLA
jgi:hypothetical protein